MCYKKTAFQEMVALSLLIRVGDDNNSRQKGDGHENNKG
jgi:hypothetical protein